MAVDRWFLLVAILYALVGIVMGEHMGATQDHAQMPTHAHVMLLGWVSMVLFALVYRAWPNMKKSKLATIHFWTFQVAVLPFLIGLWLIYGGVYENEEIGPYLGIGAIIIVISILCFALNAYKNARD